MSTTLTKKKLRKKTREKDELFGEVSSFIRNVYNTLSRTPWVLHEFMSDNYKAQRRKHKK